MERQQRKACMNQSWNFRAWSFVALSNSVQLVTHTRTLAHTRWWNISLFRVTPRNNDRNMDMCPSELLFYLLHPLWSLDHLSDPDTEEMITPNLSQAVSRRWCWTLVRPRQWGESRFYLLREDAEDTKTRNLSNMVSSWTKKHLHCQQELTQGSFNSRLWFFWPVPENNAFSEVNLPVIVHSCLDIMESTLRPKSQRNCLFSHSFPQ